MTGPSTSTKKCGRELAVFSSSTVATKGIELSPPSRYSCGKFHPEKCSISRMANYNDACRGIHSTHPCRRRLQYGSEQKSLGCKHCKNLWILQGRINGKTEPILECCPPRDTDGRNRAQKSERPLRSSFRRAGISSRCLRLPREQKKNAVTICKSFLPALSSINSNATIEKP